MLETQVRAVVKVDRLGVEVPFGTARAWSMVDEFSVGEIGNPGIGSVGRAGMKNKLYGLPKDQYC